MALETRLLPKEEWHRLIGTEAEPVWAALPDSTKVMAVEQEGELVGCWLLLPVFHLECLWVAPDHRGKTSVARRLWNLMHATARSLGVRSVFTASMDATVGHLLSHRGAVKLPGEHYVLPIRPEGD